MKCEVLSSRFSKQTTRNLWIKIDEAKIHKQHAYVIGTKIHKPVASVNYRLYQLVITLISHNIKHALHTAEHTHPHWSQPGNYTKHQYCYQRMGVVNFYWD